MTAEKAQAVIGNLVTMLTRYIMERDQMPMEEAFIRLYGSEFYELLTDPDSRLYLEEDDYLKQCVDAEFDRGIDALYAFIKR